MQMSSLVKSQIYFELSNTEKSVLVLSVASLLVASFVTVAIIGQFELSSILHYNQVLHKTFSSELNALCCTMLRGLQATIPACLVLMFKFNDCSTFCQKGYAYKKVNI